MDNSEPQQGGYMSLPEVLETPRSRKQNGELQRKIPEVFRICTWKTKPSPWCPCSKLWVHAYLIHAATHLPADLAANNYLCRCLLIPKPEPGDVFQKSSKIQFFSMSLYYSLLPSVPSKPHPQLSKEWKHGWKTKSWVSLNLQDKTNNCDQNQNPQTIATKELGLKKILWNPKTNGAVQHTYLTCTVSASLRKKEVKENNSCLMGPETRQSHTSQQNTQWELAG